MDHASPPPIIILGSERSGSNLLRKLLGNHSRIGAPRPVHFYSGFFSHLHHYGRLADPKNSVLLFDDLVAVANHPRSDWKFGVSFAEFSTRYSTETFFGLVDGLYRAQAAATGRTHYFCKDNDKSHYMPGILRERPDTKLLHLVRDPRDTVASWLRNPAFFHHPLDAARIWTADQRKTFALQDAHGIAMHRLSYEDLVEDPERTMTGVLRYLDLEPESSCFSTDPASDPEAGRVVFWENLNKPILKENVRKYRRQLSADEVRLIETFCQEGMKRLGYELETAANTPTKGRLFKYRLRLGRWRFRAIHRVQIARNIAAVLDRNALIRERVAARQRLGSAS